MPRRLKFALLIAFCLHGILILIAGYRLSYDAYNHMFFADHYLKDWWSLWEPRWYTGFEINSYPPLVHQMIALIGRLVGVDAAFGLLLWVTVTAYPLAVYSFSRIFTGKSAAGYAALGTALLPSLYLSAHVFGQLPSLVSTLLIMFGVAVLADYLRRGAAMRGALAIALFTTAMSAHHATLLFQPWLVGALVLSLFVRKEVGRRTIVFRLVSFAVITAAACLLVIWPFWEWGRHQIMQTPIDHLSRHNFLVDRNALAVFFLPMYGLLIPLLPVGVWLGLRKRYWGLGLAFAFLFLLGLGDTTPLPRLFFGSGWAWLTYDRFSFWACLVLLPMLGVAAVWFKRIKFVRRALTFTAGLMAITALVIGYIPVWFPTQPAQLDMKPVVDFLAREGASHYRYITLGFGDQLAYLSRLTDAASMDGSYHTARSLPELRYSGIAQMDTAFWFPGGLAALEPILQKSGQHGVRWGFVNLEFYEPLLKQAGWTKLSVLSNGVSVWENPSAVLPVPVRPPVVSPIASFSWGVLPLLALFVTACLAMRCYGSPASQQVFTAVEALAIGLLPFGLTMWYYRTLFAIQQPRIYFTYSSALFFLSDGLALAALLAWLIARLPLPGEKAAPRLPFAGWRSVSRPGFWLFAVCLLATLSIFWSMDGRTSLFISLHLWSCFGFYLVLRSTPKALTWFAAGCCAALLIQVAVGSWQFISQSTVVAAALGLDWPGELQPAMRGASVVQLADGARWLRAYGTFPHPNLLGGFALALLVAPLAVFLNSSRRSILPLVFFNLVLVLIVLTFSRSAWLGLVLLGLGLLAYRKNLNLKHLVIIMASAAVTLVLLVIPLRSLFFVRLGEGDVQTERVSNFTRLWLVQRTLELIQKHPLAGTGIGSYSLALSRHVEPFYQIEPVHNLALLALSELGVGGILVLGGLVVSVTFHTLHAHTPMGSVLSAALLGLAAVSMFDHYLWTLAPGRLLMATLLGLWAGQVQADETRR